MKSKNVNKILLSAQELEIGRKAIEDVLISFRDSRLSEPLRNNGLVVREKDGRPSDVIRMGPDVLIALWQ